MEFFEVFFILPLFVNMMLTRFFGENKSWKEGLGAWKFSLLASACFAVPYVVTAFVFGEEFPSLLGGLIGTALVGISYQSTAERIAQNERDALLRRMAEILPAERYDNDLLLDTSEVLAPAHLGSRPTTVYRARKEGRPVAAVLSPVTASGYAGDIALIVGIIVGTYSSIYTASATALLLGVNAQDLIEPVKDPDLLDDLP